MTTRILLTLALLMVPGSLLAEENAGSPEPTPAPASTPRPSRLTVGLALVADDGGVGVASARTARQIMIDALRSQGFEIADAPAFDAVHPLNEAVRQFAVASGAGRIYVLTLAALGEKLIVRIEEFDRDLESVDFRRAAASGVEELDVVLPRMVEALLTDVELEATARVDSVTQDEGRKWEKRPGEFNWGMGVLVGGGIRDEADAAYGLNLKFSYEMQHLRLDTDIGAMIEGDSFFRVAVGAYWLPLDGFWSPYLGGSLGYMFLWTDNDDLGGRGVGLDLGAGVEFLRLHRVRVLAGVGIVIPFFELDEDYYSYDDDSSRSRYLGMAYGTVSVLW